MQNIVLDTNSLIMSLSSKNDYRMIWKAFLDGEYMLCVTNEIIEEYMEVLARNINIRVAETIVYTILNRKNVHRLDPHFRFHLIEVTVRRESKHATEIAVTMIQHRQDN